MTYSTDTPGWSDVFAELRFTVQEVCADHDAEKAAARARHCDSVAIEAAQSWLDRMRLRNAGTPALAWVGYTDPITCGKNSIAVAAIGAGVFACFHAPGYTRSGWFSLITPCPCGAWAETEVASAHAVRDVLDQVAAGDVIESCHNLMGHYKLRAEAAGTDPNAW